MTSPKQHIDRIRERLGTDNHEIDEKDGNWHTLANLTSETGRISLLVTYRFKNQRWNYCMRLMPLGGNFMRVHTKRTDQGFVFSSFSGEFDALENEAERLITEHLNARIPALAPKEAKQAKRPNKAARARAARESS